MELWIRSQNHSKVRKLLVNVKNISYLEIDDINANNHVIIFKDINMEENELENYNCLLGAYATEERALEVLDEIQNKIKYMGQTLEVGTMTDERLIPHQFNYVDNVYEMPKE